MNQMAASDPSWLVLKTQNLFPRHPQHVLGPDLDLEAPSIVQMGGSDPSCPASSALDSHRRRRRRRHRLAHDPNLDPEDLSKTTMVLLLRIVPSSCLLGPYRRSLQLDLYPTLDDHGGRHCSRAEDGDVSFRNRCHQTPLPSRRPSWRSSPSAQRRRLRPPRPIHRERVDDFDLPLPTAVADRRSPYPPAPRGGRSGPYRTAGARRCCWIRCCCHCCHRHDPPSP